MMKKITMILILLATAGFGIQATAETVSSLRGDTDISQDSSAPAAKKYNKDKKRVKEVVVFVKEKGGLDYAITKMKEFQQEALMLLKKYPDTPYKHSLNLMVNYVIDRKK